MNPLLRKLLGPYLDEKTDTGTDLGGGGAEEVTEDPPADGGEPQVEKSPAPPDEPVELGMLKAISAQIPVDGKKTEPAAAAPKGSDGKPLTGAALAAHQAKAAAPQGETAEAKATREAQEAEAKTTADAKAAEDAKAALGKKTSKDFALSPEEKKALTSKAQERFHELHSNLKLREDELAAERATNADLAQSRDQILGVMDDYQCGPDELAPLLEYNLAVKTGKLEDALQMVDAQRAHILRELGREAPGVDLLKDYPDLSKKVENEELTREGALEVAKARRAEARATEQRTAADTAKQTEQAAQAAHDKGLKDIETWCNALAKSDIDYKAKETKILPQLKRILATYRPDQWVAELKDRYELVVVEKATKVIPEQPLRPSGSKGGGAAPGSMEEAIAKGLGYENMRLT